MCFAIQGLEKIRELMMPRLLYWIAHQQVGQELIELFVQLCFFVIPPAPVMHGVFRRGLVHDVIHVAIVFKFLAVLPIQHLLCITMCKRQQYEFRSIGVFDQHGFHFPAHLPDFYMRAEVQCEEGHCKSKEE